MIFHCQNWEDWPNVNTQGIFLKTALTILAYVEVDDWEDHYQDDSDDNVLRIMSLSNTTPEDNASTEEEGGFVPVVNAEEAWYA